MSPKFAQRAFAISLDALVAGTAAQAQTRTVAIDRCSIGCPVMEAVADEFQNATRDQRTQDCITGRFG